MPDLANSDVPASGAAAASTPPQRIAGLTATALLAAAGLFTLSDFLPALVWAVVIAIGIWPLFRRLAERWPKRKRDLLPALTVVAILVVLILPLTLIGLPILRDSHELSEWIAHARTLGVPAPPILASLPDGAELTRLWQANLGQPGGLSAIATRAMQGGVLQFGRKLGAEALHRLVLVGFMLLALFFLLRDAAGVAGQLRVASRRAIGPAGERVGLQMIRSVQGTVNGLVLVGLGEGLIMGVVYAFAGVPHAALFGVMTALLAMVPFGAGLAIAAAVVSLLIGENVVAALIVAAVGFAATFVADHFIRPVLIGGATRLPFLWVLLGILGGVETWGLVGLFVGPAVLAALMLLWREYVGRREGPLNPEPRDVAGTAS